MQNLRLQRLQERLEELKIDALLVTSLKNVRYLSNFSGTAAFLFITPGPCFFVTDFRYKTQARIEVKGFKLRFYGYTDSTIEAIKELLRELKVKNIGFEAGEVSFDTYHSWSKELPNVNFQPTKDLIESLRIVKDEDEIKTIKKAINIAEKAFLETAGKIKAGIREKEIALELEYQIRKRGGGMIPFDTIVASGKRGALPHGVATGKVIKSGEPATIDTGATYSGYNSDMTRALIVGKKVTKRYKEIYNLVLEAQMEAISNVKPGVPWKEIDSIARGIIAKAGYGQYFEHGTGHGIGLAVHELPKITPKGNGILEEGMLFTIEPGIYIPNFGGVRIEDMVLVTSTGYKVLTTLPKEWGWWE